VLDDEAHVASRRQLVWMLGAVPFGLLLAVLALAQIRRIGERTQRVARMARRMVEGDVEPFPVDVADRDELVEVQGALNEMATQIAIQSRRQAAQHAATRVLAESETLGRAMPAILKGICESLGWHWSSLWTIDRQEGVLRCGDIWHAPAVQLADFSAMSQRFTFAPGVGLPGRVWTSGESAWIPDVQQDPNFPRLPAARKVGLHGAFCFPIPAAGGLIGVMEFFSAEVAKPDTALLAMMDAIGTQIGHRGAKPGARAERAESARAQRGASTPRARLRRTDRGVPPPAGPARGHPRPGRVCQPGRRGASHPREHLRGTRLGLVRAVGGRSRPERPGPALGDVSQHLSRSLCL